MARRTAGTRTVEPDESLDAVLRRVAKGDRGAFARLYDRLGPAVYLLARRRSATEEAAEGLAEEVFTRLWRSAPGFLTGEVGADRWVLSSVSSSLAAGAGRSAGRP